MVVFIRRDRLVSSLRISFAKFNQGACMGPPAHRSFLTPQRGITALVALAAVFIAGCGAKDVPASGTFGNVYANTLNRCSTCHQPAGSGSASPLNFLTQITAYSTLLAYNSVETGCGSVRYVVPSTPQSSMLPAVLFADYFALVGVGGCSPYNVHLSNQALSASERTSLLAWISGGALNN